MTSGLVNGPKEMETEPRRFPLVLFEPGLFKHQFHFMGGNYETYQHSAVDLLLLLRFGGVVDGGIESSEETQIRTVQKATANRL